MKFTMTAISKRQCARFYIYKKVKKLQIVLYTKSKTLCKKQDNSRYFLYTKKLDTLRYAILHEMFEFGNYMQQA